jgi:hypothetical protein
MDRKIGADYDSFDRRHRTTEDRISMAQHSEVAHTTPDDNDYAAHEQTYEGFLRLVKYSVASIALLLILMAIFLT